MSKLLWFAQLKQSFYDAGMALGQNLRKFRKEKGWSQDALSARTNGKVSQGAISALEKRDSSASEHAADLAKALGISLSELLTGEKEGKTAFLAEETRNNYGNIGEKIPLWGRVPIISWVAAGNWSVSVDNFQPGEADEWVATTLKVKKHTFALRVQGQSMEPRFPEGGVIIVEPDEEARNGSFVIVRQNGDETTFKQLEIDGGRYLLVPLNPKFQAMEMKPDAVICGVVKQLVLDV